MAWISHVDIVVVVVMLISWRIVLTINVVGAVVIIALSTGINSV
jgi:hypothetical protein